MALDCLIINTSVSNYKLERRVILYGLNDCIKLVLIERNPKQCSRLFE